MEADTVEKLEKCFSDGYRKRFDILGKDNQKQQLQRQEEEQQQTLENEQRRLSKRSHDLQKKQKQRRHIHHSHHNRSPLFLDYIREMHSCFSNLTAARTWPKSLDFTNTCPFHYNHWSCDGGIAAGRQLGCRCRVSLSWYKKPSDMLYSNRQCHLAHYNTHSYSSHAHRSGEVEGPSRIAVLDS